MTEKRINARWTDIDDGALAIIENVSYNNITFINHWGHRVTVSSEYFEENYIPESSEP